MDVLVEPLHADLGVAGPRGVCSDISRNMSLDVPVIVAASATAFVASSMDNLLLLVAFKANDSMNRRSVRAAYVLAVATVAALAYGLAYAAEGRVPFRLSYLGILPILAGVYYGLRSVRVGAPIEEAQPKARDAADFLSVLVTMLANSADSLVVLAALFADTRRDLDWISIATVLVMSVVWLRIAAFVAGHPRYRLRMERVSRYVLPFALVGLGLYILSNTPTDVV